MVKNSLVFLAVVAMVLFVQPVRADVLYSSGVAWNNTFLGQYGISGTGVYVTDPFTLSSASTITSIDLGLLDAMIGSNHYDPSTLDYTIQDGTGAVKSNGTVGLTTLNNQAGPGGSWEFLSEFSLNANLAAGTYYLTLANGSATTGATTREDIGWIFNQTNSNLTAWTSRNFMTNAANVSAESFIINGTTGSAPVPEPATMLLLGLGLLGLGGFRKRLFKK